MSRRSQDVRRWAHSPVRLPTGFAGGGGLFTHHPNHVGKSGRGALAAGPTVSPANAPAARCASRAAATFTLRYALYAEMTTSRGSRATHRYVQDPTTGSPSSGVWVLMNRRCCWASSRAVTSASGAALESNHGDNTPNGAGSWSVWKINNAQIICAHVVPHFWGAHTTTSSARNTKPSQRELSKA